IIQLFALSESGLTPDLAWKESSYEETSLCGSNIVSQVSDLSLYYRLGVTLGTDGEFDPEKEVDILVYTGGGDVASDNTTYTVSELTEMRAYAEDLSWLADEAVNNYAYNDAGINKQKFLDYQDGYYETDTSDEGEVSEAATESTEAFSGEDAEGSRSVKLEELQTFEQFQPDGEVFVPSDSTVKSLTDAGLNPDDYSSQFLFLYENGKQYEKVKSKGGTYLYEYAAKNSKTVSLMDLYHAILQVTVDVQQYQDYMGIADLRSSNLWYCIELEDGSVYTNVENWKSGYDKAVSLVKDYPFALACERKNDYPTFYELTSGNGKDAVNRVKSYLRGNDIIDKNEKVLFALDPELSQSDIHARSREVYENWKPILPALLISAIVGGIFSLICIVLMTLQCGRNTRDRSIKLYAIDRMPTEAAAVVGFGVLCLGLGAAGLGFSISYDGYYYDEIYGGYYFSPDLWRAVVGAAGILAGVYICLIVYCSLVRRIKGKNLWEKSLIHGIAAMCRDVYQARKKSERLLLVFGAFCFLQILLNWGFGGFGVVMALILDLLVLLYLIQESAGRQTIQEGLKQIGSGDLDYKIRTETLHGDNLEMARTVNSVGEGLKVAVQEQMKSERLKADLITNVSHDIKTPLTSIINYVDLLKREQIEDPKIKGYIEVLDGKSQRLKQLTEDLVEASKISSGNIKLEFMNLNLNELVQQVNGEFDERFHGRNLDLICSLTSQPSVIRADSRRIWRVLENLYVNVCKYAMPGTRVYVETSCKNGKVYFSIKNISENPLNIDADELTERFIRGDVSRSTEGSGLGLSIAKNLTALQHGTFEIYLDGDLFKVTITFDEAAAEI
ncbi:MAG: HAMP domain-containing sensor histidine kinase, partial [Fusicatenibacter sp.]|nr:HAMP domain-containing sensor histidine kinase [Fusicatenibacter sp.]